MARVTESNCRCVSCTCSASWHIHTVETHTQNTRHNTKSTTPANQHHWAVTWRVQPQLSPRRLLASQRLDIATTSKTPHARYHYTYLLTKQNLLTGQRLDRGGRGTGRLLDVCLRLLRNRLHERQLTCVCRHALEKQRVVGNGGGRGSRKPIHTRQCRAARAS